jgi:hypothetical protein
MKTMKIFIEYESNAFWEGSIRDIKKIPNILAQMVANTLVVRGPGCAMFTFGTWTARWKEEEKRG